MGMAHLGDLVGVVPRDFRNVVSGLIPVQL